MEIKLSEADMNTLAELVADRLENQVMAMFVINESFAAISDRARKMAELHINKQRFNAEAKIAFQAQLEENGGIMLREIVDESIVAAFANTDGMAKNLEILIQQQAIHAVKLFADRFRSEDEF